MAPNRRLISPYNEDDFRTSPSLAPSISHLLPTKANNSIVRLAVLWPLRVFRSEGQIRLQNDSLPGGFRVTYGGSIITNMTDLFMGRGCCARVIVVENPPNKSLLI